MQTSFQILKLALNMDPIYIEECMYVDGHDTRKWSGHRKMGMTPGNGQVTGK